MPQEMEHGHAFILLNKAETKSALNGNEVASKITVILFLLFAAVSVLGGGAARVCFLLK